MTINRRQAIVLLAAFVLLMVGAIFGIFGWVFITDGGGADIVPTIAPTLDRLATPTLSDREVNQLLEQNITLQAQVEALQATNAALQEP